MTEGTEVEQLLQSLSDPNAENIDISILLASIETADSLLTTVESKTDELLKKLDSVLAELQDK